MSSLNRNSIVVPTSLANLLLLFKRRKEICKMETIDIIGGRTKISDAGTMSNRTTIPSSDEGAMTQVYNQTSIGYVFMFQTNIG
jgi:hypothetical protein